MEMFEPRQLVFRAVTSIPAIVKLLTEVHLMKKL